MVCSSAVHVCWEKLFNYFDIEPRYVNLTEDCFVAKPEEVCPEFSFSRAHGKRVLFTLRLTVCWRVHQNVPLKSTHDAATCLLVA